MKKINKMRFGLYSAIGVIVLVVVVGIGIGVGAFNSSVNPQTVIENFNGDYNAATMMDMEQPLGAMASPDFASPYISVNGDVMYHVRADAKDDSVVLLSLDPSAYGLNATATVSHVAMRINGVATSSIVVTCGGATTATANPTFDLMTTGTIATSTGVGCVIENGLLTADNSSSACADGGSIQKIGIGDTYSYFNCTATSTATTQAGWNSGDPLTNAANTFDADFVVRFNQIR